jgi:hypothetical protein
MAALEMRPEQRLKCRFLKVPPRHFKELACRSNECGHANTNEIGCGGLAYRANAQHMTIGTVARFFPLRTLGRVSVR